MREQDLRRIILVTWILLIILIPFLTYTIFELLGEQEGTQAMEQDLALSGILQGVYNNTHNTFFENESKIFASLGLVEYTQIVSTFSLVGVLIGIVIDVSVSPLFVFMILRELPRPKG